MGEEGLSIIVRDIGRKCGDDVGSAICRNMQLVDTPRDRMMVAMYGASAALGNATGAWLGSMGLPCEPVAGDFDQLWRELLRPMVLGHLGAGNAG